MSSNNESNAVLRDNASKVVTFKPNGSFLIGDEDFPYPVIAGSAKVEPHSGGYNKLTITILVGEVVMKTKTKPVE